MNSGNRIALVSLVLLGVFAAADAGRVREDGTGTRWIAPEFLEPTTLQTGCRGTAVQVTELADAGRVAFEWHPETGELSFDARGAMPQVTLPEDWLPDSEMSELTTQSCESR